MPHPLDRSKVARRAAVLGLLGLLAIPAPALRAADAPSPQDIDLFENHVRPTLVARCIRCHGETKQESGLRLTSRDDALRGGDSGPAIVPGKPAESLLLEALRYESLEMPPDGPLDEPKIAGIEAWIAAGAPWPQGAVLKPAAKITDADRAWWSFQPVVDPPVPEVPDDDWCRNEIDRFIAARLAREGLQPTAAADATTLARRLHFAVTGLPPDAPFVTALVSGSERYEALVDRLLDDPAYGENQARFWLDLVRYADTDGYRADAERPQAHRYRDYVIRSFNDDKPYDRFLSEQLAGDEIDPGNPDALVATMYLRHWIYEWNQRDVETQWQEILNDLTETTADAFLALGLKCARCHDHKFDPLLQTDYFRLQAFFAPFQPREDFPVADVETRAAHFAKQRAWEEATADLRRQLHAIEWPVLLAHTTKEGFDKFVPEIREMIALAADLDGDANDIRLVPDLLPQVRRRTSGPRLWLADSAYCDLLQTGRFTEENDSFLLRYNAKTKFLRDEAAAVAKGVDDAGRRFVDERGWLGAESNRHRRYVRRITLQREDGGQVAIVTDLLDGEAYPAKDLLELYRQRWGIEQVFQQVTEVFGLERLIGGRAEATIFQFAFCLLLYNQTQLVRAYVAKLAQW